MTPLMDSPYFSIVIPAYNRAGLIPRAMDSCLGQDWRDFEVIVVDDGSTDGTSGAVRRYSDPRVRLAAHEVNRGVCPARNTGVGAARGEWIVFLDSDDELLPGALRMIRNRTAEAGPEIRRIVFMYRLDEGGLSPDPPLEDDTWDYEKYIRWAERGDGPGDYCNVIRRSAFGTVRYPDGKAVESAFHLDFCRNFLTRTFPEVVGIVHSDAGNRSMDHSIGKLVAEAPDNAAALASLLLRHGPALRRLAPSMHFKLMRGAATAHFLAGLKAGGVRYAAGCLRQHLSLGVMAVLIFGLLGPGPLAWLKTRMT